VCVFVVVDILFADIVCCRHNCRWDVTNKLLAGFLRSTYCRHAKPDCWPQWRHAGAMDMSPGWHFDAHIPVFACSQFAESCPGW